MFKPLAPALVAVALAPASAWAEGGRVATLPAVTVEGAGDYPLAFFPAAAGGSADFLDRAAIEVAHDRSVDEVLRGYPGVSVSKTGLYQDGAIYLRGAGGQGLATWDGLPVPDDMPASLNLSALLPEALENMQVIRGYASQPFASLGGSVRMTSRRASQSGVGLHVEAGTFAYLKETLRADYAGERGGVAFTANRADSFDGAYQAKKSNGNHERDTFNITQQTVKAHWEFADNLEWEGSMLHRSERTGWDTFTMRDTAWTMVDDKHAFYREDAWMAQNRLRARLTPNWTSGLQVGFVQQRNRANPANLVVPTAPPRLSLGYDTDLYLARWENDNTLWSAGQDRSAHLVWGAEGRHERATAPNYVDPINLVQGAQHDEHRTMQSAFGELHLVLGALSGDVGLRSESYQRYGSHTLLHASAAWQAADTLRLRASGGNGFRIPSYAERFFPLEGNTALRPERGVGGDAGLDWQPVKDVKLSATGFYNRYDDQVVLLWNNAPGADIPCLGICIANVANTAIAGIETAGEVRVDEQWRFGANYTYTDSENLQNGRRVPLRPRDSGRIWGEWRAAALPVTVWLETTYQGRNYNDVANTMVLGSAAHLNARVSYKVAPKVELYLRGENLNNNRTSEMWGFDTAGTAVYGGVVWNM